MHEIRRINNSSLRYRAQCFINKNHSYIDHTDRPSRKLYWALFEQGEMVGVFALSSVFDKPKKVKEFMIRNKLGSNQVANNIVYCLSGSKDKNAGSKFLSRLREDGIIWWYERYGDFVKAFQTFILPPRNGAVYKADNWQVIGETSGYSQMVRTVRPSEAHKFENVKKRVFNNGETRWTINEYRETEKKLILMRLVSAKETRRAMRKYDGKPKQLALF